MTTIIAIYGKARHGKGLFAGSLAMEIPGSFTYSFSTPLRETCKKLGMVGKDAAFMQKLADEMRRENEDFFINFVANDIANDKPEVAIIDDLRLRREAEWVRRNGGLIVKVVRVNADMTPFVADDRPADHITETDMDGWTDFDFSVTAMTGDIEALEAGAQHFVEKFAAKIERKMT